MSRYVRVIPGSAAYWDNCQQSLKQLCETFGPPNVFYSRSYADYHWPVVRKILLPHKPNATTLELKRVVLRSPHIATMIFEKYSTTYSKYYKKLYNVSYQWERVEFQGRNTDHLHRVLQFSKCPDLTKHANKAIEGHMAQLAIDKHNDVTSNICLRNNLLEELKNKIEIGEASKLVIKKFGQWFVSCENPANDENGPRTILTRHRLKLTILANGNTTIFLIALGTVLIF